MTPRDDLRALAKARDTFKWLDAQGGHGYREHVEMRARITELDAALAAAQQTPQERERKRREAKYGTSGVAHETPAPRPAEERRQCACALPDPVMQADRRFYCHICSFQVPAVLCVRCQDIAIVPRTPARLPRRMDDEAS